MMIEIWGLFAIIVISLILLYYYADDQEAFTTTTANPSFHFMIPMGLPCAVMEKLLQIHAMEPNNVC